MTDVFIKAEREQRYISHKLDVRVCMQHTFTRARTRTQGQARKRATIGYRVYKLYVRSLIGVRVTTKSKGILYTT